MRSFFPQVAASAIGLLTFVSAMAVNAAPTPAPATPAPLATPARPATPPPPATPAPFIGKLSLVRYDTPLAFSDGYAPTHQVAKVKEGEEAVAWPNLTLNNKPIFRKGGEEDVALKLRTGAEASSPFQLPTDEVFQPGNHWLRAMDWRRGLRHLYTADFTARTSGTAGTMTGRYELWLFSVIIQGEGGPVVRNVEVKIGNASIFKQPGPWRSLTLLLPQSEPGKPYVLIVDGRPPVTFSTGLQPVKLGRPSAAVLPVSASIGGEGPRVSVRSLDRPAEFPNPKEWAADLAALAKPLPPATPFDRGRGLQRYLSAEVPASPLTLYAAGLPHGMSSGFFKKGTDPEAYAQFIAKLGYDTVFDPATTLPAPADADSIEKRAPVLASHGIRFGLQDDQNWTRPALQHPNLTFFAHALPDWHAPLYRSLSLAAQRFTRLPNFSGLQVGSDNAGYSSHWSWAPPVPDRPWGEAMVAFAGAAQPRVLRAATLGPAELPYEQPVKTMAEFTKYVERYEVSFQQYSYFAEAVREVNPRLVFTTGSFGSAPGIGGRGGWPWASIPGRVLAEGLSVQQAYDSNETHAAKPLHCVALVDRLHSYFPKKPTWALLDNHQFLYGREAWQRACALLLTRGVQGVGTNFLARPDEGARPEVIAAQAEMNDWMHKFGGVYARTDSEATIGVFYGQLQAVQRRILTAESLKPEELLQGSHEGKVTEALFFCHAAGWPARVITYQELLRGPLPSSMQAILLVGLDQADPSWNWGTGLEPTLQKFLDRGGRILTDEESVCPVSSTNTGMKVAAYVPQLEVDPTPMLLTRNGDNIARLRAAMEGVPAPLASSTNETLWAIPTTCADTQYVTVVNQACAEGDEARERVLPADPKATKPELWKFKGNASLYVKPQTGALQWHTQRPIYDIRLGSKVTAEEAAAVDLTKDGFRWYALPPGEITAPEITVEKGVSGFYEARVKISGSQRMGGVPVAITVAGPIDAATVYSVTETPIRLPLRDTDDGEFTITARELLTNLEGTAKVTNHAQAPTVSARPQVTVREPVTVGKFAARKKLPLTIALTPEQEKDVALTAQVKTLKGFYEKKGRAVSLGTVKAGGIVESLQPLKSPHRYPQWKTVATDLVLFGTPANNVLLLDQARGEILPRNFAPPPPTEAVLLYTRSPFVGECDALNIIATDEPGFAAAVQKITTMP